MFNLLAVVLLRSGSVFAKMLQDCHAPDGKKEKFRKLPFTNTLSGGEETSPNTERHSAIANHFTPSGRLTLVDTGMRSVSFKNRVAPRSPLRARPEPRRCAANASANSVWSSPGSDAAADEKCTGDELVERRLVLDVHVDGNRPQRHAENRGAFPCEVIRARRIVGSGHVR